MRQAGLTQEEARSLLEVSERTAYRYANGTVRLPRLAKKVLHEAANKKPASHNTAFRFIDLFAGIGGLRIGFNGIGGHCVFTSEWDANAQKTYALNFRDNHPIAGDIREFSEHPEGIPEHDVLLAGFPCRALFDRRCVKEECARTATRVSVRYTRNAIFRYCPDNCAPPPGASWLETQNFASHDKGRTFATIMNVLENELGYRVQTRVISSEPWVPQRRERVFIVGFREDTDFDLDALELPSAEDGPKLRQHSGSARRR